MRRRSYAVPLSLVGLLAGLLLAGALAAPPAAPGGPVEPTVSVGGGR